MPKPYPDPIFNTTTDMFKHVNNITSGWAINLFIIIIPIVVFILMRSKDYKVSSCLLVSFFIGFLASSFFWAAGLLAGKIVMIMLLFSMASGIYQQLDD